MTFLEIRNDEDGDWKLVKYLEPSPVSTVERRFLFWKYKEVKYEPESSLIIGLVKEAKNLYNGKNDVRVRHLVWAGYDDMTKTFWKNGQWLCSAKEAD